MFCKYCGKQIPDGQVCECQTAPAPVEVQQPVAAAPVEPAAPAAAPAAPAVAPAAPAVPAEPNKYVVAVTNAFKGMPDALKRMVGNTFGAGCDMPSAIIFAAGGLILHILAWICIVGGLLGELKDAIMTLSGGLGSMMDLDAQFKTMFKGIYGMAVWAGCLSYVIPLAVAFAIPSVGQLLRKENVDVKHHFIVAANVCVVPAALLILGGLLSLASFKIGMIFIVIAVLDGIIVSFKLLAKQMKSTNTLAGTLLAAVIVTAIVALVAWIVSSAVTGYFTGTFVQNVGMEITDLLEYFM